MFHISSEETFHDGQIIFEEGSHGDWIYLIEEGAVELSKVIDGEEAVIEILASGDIFGEIAFIADTPRTARARAKGTTVLGIFDRQYLDNEFNKMSDVFQAIIKRLAIRIAKTTEVALRLKVRRQGNRSPRVLALTFRSGDSLIKAFSENVNTEGLFIRTNNQLPVGDHFFLKLQLPKDDLPLRIGCEVAWARPVEDSSETTPAGMGLKFTEITPQDQARLSQAIADATNGSL